MLTKIDKKEPAETGTMGKLSGPQATALLVLAGGGRKSDAARHANVHPQAISAWFRDPHFCQALSGTRSDLIREATCELRLLSHESLAAMQSLLKSGPPSVRFKAAAYVLDRVLMIKEYESTERIGESEEEIDEKSVLAAFGIPA